MIKVNITKNQIKITGHAMYDDYGKDIVCASVSSIVITSVNLALRLNKQSLNYKEAEGLLVTDILSHDLVTDTIILNMIELLKELEKNYSKNIKINEEV